MLISKILVMFGVFILLSAIGLGAAVILISRRDRHRLVVSIALSPAIGAIIVAFLLYIFFLLGVPIRLSALPITLVGIILSSVLIGLDWRASRLDYREILSGVSRWKPLAVIVTWGGVLLLLLLPSILGGKAFQYYQGTPYDATNYVSMAIFGRDFPASYVGNPEHSQEIIQYNPALVVSMTGLANARPSVSHLLAWESILFHQTPLEFYFFHKLLSLLITASIAFALGYQFGLHWWQKLAFVVVSSTGFWIIYVINIDALSNLYAVPISLLAVSAFVQFEREGRNSLFSRHRCFLALSLAGLFCFYPEIALPFFAALALYYVQDLLWNPSQLTLRVILMHLVTVVIAALLLNIIFFPVIKFALGQYQLAANSGLVDAAKFFYHWLFFDHGTVINGLWGLYYFHSSPNELILIQVIKALLMIIMFVIMSSIVGTGTLKSLVTRKSSPENRFLAVLIGVYWGGGLLLYLIGNNWVAGKMLVMGAPFMVLGVFVFFKDYFFDVSLGKRLLQTGLVVWVITQALVMPLETLTIYGNSWFPYTFNFANSAFSDVIVPVVNRLKQEEISSIGLEISGPKLPIVFALAIALRDLRPIWFSDGISPTYDVKTNDINPEERWMTADAVPDILVLSDKRDYLKPLGLGESLISVSSVSLLRTPGYITAYTVTPNDFDQALYRADILNPDIPPAPVIRGMDAVFLPNKGDQFIRWMINDSSEMHFLSGTGQSLGMSIESSATYNGVMNLEFNNTSVGEFLTKMGIQTQSNSICVTPKVGSNIFTFIHKTIEPSDKNRILVSKLLFAPVNTLDIGAVGDARQIGKGWEAQENWGEETVRWAAQDTQLQIMTCGGSVERELHFRAFLPPEVASQSITVTINGTEVGTIGMSAGWKEYTATVPSDLLQTTGLQSIEIHHSNTFAPAADTRILSAAYDRFWFTNR